MSMSKIVRAAADIIFVFILTFGFYIVAHGHLTPGGGFQGGAVIATGFVLLIAAYGSRALLDRFGKEWFRSSEALGLLVFIGTAFVALFLGATFFANWLANGGLIFGEAVAFGPNPGDLNTGGVIPIMNIAVGIEVLGALSLIVLYMLSGTEEGA
ncbi:sodium:proton antiporter [Methanoculleus sp. FWC-SCC1]|uniref:Sodium:proton antiporter n=1 Tax=Methanoculleus frigidifontis TaxID=2584085 RepID=A0ABT8MD96_9EURY|nr:MnhB domain-containing protein [Methanoculleus sp. FWC-SCC1]MDN7025861.1 sodium:proton antiporter [Methanoculleus sp. FWC-SCC1]